MSCFKDKARQMKILKRDNDLLKEELKMSQDKFETLEKDHKVILDKTSEKSIEEHEIALQSFITTGLERTKFASMIYGVSKS